MPEQLIYESPDGAKFFVNPDTPPALRKYTLRGVFPAGMSWDRIDEVLATADRLLTERIAAEELGVP